MLIDTSRSILVISNLLHGYPGAADNKAELKHVALRCQSFVDTGGRRDPLSFMSISAPRALLP